MRKQQGFTLLEMSIVITVIALIIGGIVVGKSLKRSAQLQSVIGEATKYSQTLNDFRNKYNAYPGDFAAAEAIWGSDAACPNTPYTTTPHKETCNGNGDSSINGFGMSPEVFRAWQQLANAGMIEGAYTGVTGPSGGADQVPGLNIPASKLTNGSWAWQGYVGGPDTFLIGGTPFSGWFWTKTGRQFIEFGGRVSGDDNWAAVITPQEALNIDSKIDDGLPGTGLITTLRNDVGEIDSCTTTSGPAATQYMYARYNTAYTSIACSFMVQTDF